MRWSVQVEHGITELTCGVDLVQWMLRLGVPGLQVGIGFRVGGFGPVTSSSPWLDKPELI